MFNRWLFSYALLTSSFLSFPLSAECISSPDCTDLGYDKTSCPSGDGILKCPFDTTKLKCIPKTCETIGKRTCGDMCVTDSFSGCCSDSDCTSGQMCINNTCELVICAVGDIYYSDKTCSTNLISGKTPIGVVGKISNGGKNGIVVALDTAYDNKSGSGIQWGCYGTDLSLTNYRDQTSAKTDFSGKSNTQTIMNECSTRPIAASYCNGYTKGGVSGWYLPAYGELYAILYTNFSTVNAGLGKISSRNQISSGYWYWSSTEFSSYTVLVPKSGAPDWRGNYKNASDTDGDFYIRCVLAF